MTGNRTDFERGRLAAVTHQLATGMDRGLSPFLQALPGYWPVGVIEDLGEIGSAESELSSLAGSLLSSLELSAVDPDLGDEVRRALPVPHPLDADWRFTVRTRELLLEIADEHSPRRETLLLGTPSLFAHMCAQLDLRAAVLIDTNLATVVSANRLSEGHDLLRAQCADLMNSPDVHLAPIFDTVIADPPWYFAEHRSFLDMASALLLPGGVVLMAAAPSGTRPSADADRAQLHEHADAAGFDVVETLWGSVGYTSSPFERAALRACGLPSIPTDWRRADLLIFRKSSRPPRAASSRSLRPANWIDSACGRTRIKMNPGSTPFSGDSDHFAGLVSPSVSRLAPERTTANLWTSGNGAFEVSSALIAAIIRGDSRWRASSAGAALREALEREASDLREWGWQ